MTEPHRTIQIKNMTLAVIKDPDGNSVEYVGS